ncbi:hypothetical protein [Sphingomonas sp. T1]|uniref:hypothetical protein n=1 Tax=Sphingomonas sp. T1 TaxID=2653172 RepID=UPI001915CE4A|nr:hypothetical protein [Sphingomonas sp. T1]
MTFPDGSARYFRGRVFGAPETADGADSMLMATPTVEICSKVVKLEAGVTPTPSPTLSKPSISPTSGAVGTTFTATDGIPGNATITGRRWLLGTTAIGTGTTVTPNAAGSLTRENTAVGTNGETITSTSAAVTVLAATATPAPSLSLSSAVAKAEGNSGTTLFSWTLTLNRDGSTAAYPFTWSTAGSGTNPANAADFGGAFPTGSGTFAAGETSKTINVLVAGDTAVEPDDTFTLTVTASGLNTVTSTGTISNDDSASAATERVATYGTSVPVLTANKKGGNLQRCTRKTIIFGADVPYITGSFDNYATQPGGDTPVGAALTILQHAYLKPDGSGMKIATFDNGASTTKLLGTDAATGIRIFHDRVYPADIYGAGVTMFRRGDRITLQTDALVSNDQTTADMTYNCHCAPMGDYSIEFPATGVPVAPGVGAITGQTGQVNANDGYTVSCVYGPHTGVAHLNLGDSISMDTGDTPLSSIRGGYSRAATNSYQGNPVPLVNLARHGTVMNDIFNTDLSAKSTGLLRMAYMAAGTFQQASENWAANDLGTSPAQSTYDTTSANKLRLWQILRNRGCEWITSVAPTPRTTSGTVNTPVNAGWARGGIADQLNQFLEDQKTAGTINHIVRSLNLRLSTDRTNDNYFVYRTLDYALDGTHFQPTGYVAVIPEHRFAVLRGNVANDEPTFTIGQIVRDTFTTGVGASIADRPTDTGQSWTRQGTGDQWVTAEGRAYAKQNGFLYITNSAMSKDQYAERDSATVTASTGAQHLFLRRQADSTVSAGYSFSFFPNTLAVSISRVSIANVSTAMVTNTLSADPGTEYTMRAEARGPYLNFYMGPIGGPLTLVASTFDASYPLGDVAIRDTSNATATTGRHMAEFRAGNLAAFTGS